MVRTAVKTLTLNVYGIRLPAVQRFVTSRPAAAYLAELATYIAEQCQVGIEMQYSTRCVLDAVQGEGRWGG